MIFRVRLSVVPKVQQQFGMSTRTPQIRRRYYFTEPSKLFTNNTNHNIQIIHTKNVGALSRDVNITLKS